MFIACLTGNSHPAGTRWFARNLDAGGKVG